MLGYRPVTFGLLPEVLGTNCPEEVKAYQCSSIEHFDNWHSRHILRPLELLCVKLICAFSLQGRWRPRPLRSSSVVYRSGISGHPQLSVLLKGNTSY